MLGFVGVASAPIPIEWSSETSNGNRFQRSCCIQGAYWSCGFHGLDHIDDEEVALAEYIAFKTEVVSQLRCPSSDGCWRLTGREIDAALRETVGEPVALSVN